MCGDGEPQRKATVMSAGFETGSRRRMAAICCLRLGPA